MACSSMVEQGIVNPKVAGSSPAVPVGSNSIEEISMEELRGRMRLQNMVWLFINRPDLLIEWGRRERAVRTGLQCSLPASSLSTDS